MGTMSVNVICMATLTNDISMKQSDEDLKF